MRNEIDIVRFMLLIVERVFPDKVRFKLNVKSFNTTQQNQKYDLFGSETGQFPIFCGYLGANTLLLNFCKKTFTYNVLEFFKFIQIRGIKLA
jgi:hypothetical protein